MLVLFAGRASSQHFGDNLTAAAAAVRRFTGASGDVRRRRAQAHAKGAP